MASKLPQILPNDRTHIIVRFDIPVYPHYGGCGVYSCPDHCGFSDDGDSAPHCVCGISIS